MSETGSKFSLGKLPTYLSDQAEKSFHKFFYWWGLNIWKYPCRFVLTGIFITFICGIGIINLDEESRSFYLYVPRDGKIWSEFRLIENTFGTLDSGQFLTVSGKNGINILEPEIFNEMLLIYEKYYNLSIIEDDEIFTYSDLCERSYPSSPVCYDRESNLFTFFGFNPLNWQNKSEILTVINNPSIPIFYFIGGLTYDNDGNIIEATTLRITYTLEGTKSKKIFKAGLKLQGEFQDYWEKHGKDYENLDVLYITDRSFDDEISRLVSADIPVFIGALITMVVYLSFALGKLNCVEGRPLSGFLAIFVLIGDLIIAFGVGSASGYPYNTLVLLIPYILLGIGVDDMIILVDSIDNTIKKYGSKKEDQSLRGQQFAEAISHVGLQISLTSFCSVAAFIAGIFITLPGIKVFCVYASVAFIADYVLQFLIFAPCLAFSQRRISQKRNILCPCYIHENFDLLADVKEKELTVKNPKNNTSTKCENGGENDSDDEDNIMSLKDALNGKSPHPILRIPWIVDHILIDRLLGTRINRIILIILFILIFIASCISIPYVKRTSDPSRLVPDDSYIIDIIDKLNEAFDNNFLSEIYIILRNIDLSIEENRNITYDMLSALENTTWSIPPTLEWLSPYENTYLPSKNLSVKNLTSSQFYYNLKLFSNDSESAYWHTEIVYDDYNNPTFIKSTRLILFIAQPRDAIKQWRVRRNLFDIYKSFYTHKKNGFVWSYNWGFSYLTKQVRFLTISNIITATISVFIILIFLMDIRNAFFILITVIVIDIDLFGWMVIIGIILDSVAFAQLVMAVGLTVDYIIHTSHAIADVKPYNISFKKRLKISMLDMGVSVIKGGWTTFLGCLALAGSTSAGFRAFFQLFTGIIIIALAHGLIFVPCVMGEVFYFINRNNNTKNKLKKSIELQNTNKTNESKPNGTEINGKTNYRE